MTTNTNSSQHSPPNNQITGGTIIAIIAILFAGAWIAFAFYKGTTGKAEDGGTILLLHPIVPIMLIVMLTSIRSWIEVKRVVTLQITMIGIWLFANLLNVLMPFLLGFAFAYFFRFLLSMMQDIPLPKGRRLQLSRGWARGILMVILLGILAVIVPYFAQKIVKQSREMSGGLVRFYHQTIVPFVVGEEFYTITVQPDKPEVIYLGTARGIYRRDRNEKKTTDLTDGKLLGQTIRTIAVTPGGKHLYVGTTRGLYRRTEMRTKRRTSVSWNHIEAEPLKGASVHAIAIPEWNPNQLYVGIDAGLFRSDDAGATWEAIAEDTNPSESTELTFLSSIQNIACSSRLSQTIYVSSDQGIFRGVDEDGDGALTWSQIPVLPEMEDLPIQAMSVTTFDGKERLYVGISQGIYQWDMRDGWRYDSDMAAQLPQSISLLGAISDTVLYAGNREVLHYTPHPQTSWSLLTQAGEGAFTKLDELPMLADTKIAQSAQEYLRNKLPTLAQRSSEFVGTLVKSFSSIALGFGGFLATAFLTLMVFIYASQSLRNYVRNFINLFPESSRNTVKLYLTEIDQNMQSFLKGQVTVILIVSIISITVYSLIGVPFALVVGLLAGLCNAIPTFGPFIGGGFAVLSLLTGFAGGYFDISGFLIRLVVLLGAILGIQTIDNSFISPKVMSSAVDVDPLLIMFGVIVGASILGFWGVLLAIPIIVVIKSVLTVSREVRGQEGSG